MVGMAAALSAIGAGTPSRPATNLVQPVRTTTWQTPTAYVEKGGQLSPYYDDPAKLAPKEWRFDLQAYSDNHVWGALTSTSLSGVKRKLEAEQKFAKSYARFTSGDENQALTEELNFFKPKGPIAVMEPGQGSTSDEQAKASRQLHSLLEFAGGMKLKTDALKVMSGLGYFGEGAAEAVNSAYGKAFGQFLDSVLGAARTLAKVTRSQSLGRHTWEGVQEDFNGILSDLDAASDKLGAYQGLAARLSVDYDPSVAGFVVPASFAKDLQVSEDQTNALTGKAYHYEYTVKQELSVTGHILHWECISELKIDGELSKPGDRTEETIDFDLSQASDWTIEVKEDDHRAFKTRDWAYVVITRRNADPRSSYMAFLTLEDANSFADYLRAFIAKQGGEN